MQDEEGAVDFTASDFLELDRNILRCAVFDGRGQILSSSESKFGLESSLSRMSEGDAVAGNFILEDLPREFGKVKFKILVTDTYRIVLMRISDRLVMFALPSTVHAEPICQEAQRRYESQVNDMSGYGVVTEPRCESCGKLVTIDSDPSADAYFVDIEEVIGGIRRTIHSNIPIRICSDCKRKFGRPKYIFHGKVEFER